MNRLLIALLGAVLLTSCAHEANIPSSQGHISQPPQTQAPGVIPPPVTLGTYLPPPKPSVKAPTYSVVVNEVPAKELLFALARDTKVNIDVHPSIQGTVTLNAVNETLPAILDRIAKQISMRYSLEGDTLVIVPDTPYLKTYRVDYVNLKRTTNSTIGVATQIASTGTSTLSAGSATSASSGGGNSSNTTVQATSNNDFWDVLTENIRNILVSTNAVKMSAEEKAERIEAQRAARAQRLQEVEAVSRAGSAAATLYETALGSHSTGPTGDAKDAVIVNPVAGTVSVLATEKQHALIQQYLDRVQTSVQRQVLIEATIVEVSLKDQYKAGVDWSRLSSRTGIFFSTQPAGDSNLANSLSSFFTIGYANTGSDFKATINLLESFGKTRVLSSPKIMALNNQTSLLKVVDNLVYFSVEVTPGTNLAGGGSTNATYSTTAHTVPVGVVMSVTPQINENGVVSLVVRPTISRKNGDQLDPNPDLAKLGVKNPVPIIQVREMESVLQVNSGQTVILGGLMQDDASRNRDGIPGLSRAEGIGALFGQHEDQTTQTELVIFLRPTVITNPTLDSDELRFYRRYLPTSNASSQTNIPTQ
jgi:MSHA type pilus biogenesis protein MshL